MSPDTEIESRIRRHRKELFGAWAAVGMAVVTALLLFAPQVYYLRGIAPWPRRWMIAFFVSLWCWAGLRLIARWVWAWVLMALAPLCLFIPLRFYLNAWWLVPLLGTVMVLSLISVVGVVARELRHRRRQQAGSTAAVARADPRQGRAATVPRSRVG
jgi:hypothetical protein